MPKGVYKRKPKPPDPFKMAKGRTIVSMESDIYNAKVVIKLDNGSKLIFEGYEDSMMFNDRWPAVAVSYILPKEK